MTSTPRSSRTTGRAYVYALLSTVVCLIAFGLSFGYHLTALGIVFVVLFAVSLITAIVFITLTAKRTNAVIQQVLREDRELRARRSDG